MLNSLDSLKSSLKIGLTVAALVAVASMFFPNYYRSEAKVLPVSSKAGGGGLAGLAAAATAFGMNVPGGEGADANFTDILSSRTIRDQLLNSQFSYQTGGYLWHTPELRKTTLLAYLKAKNVDRGVKQLDSIFTCSRDTKTKVLSIVAETRSPELSSEIVHRSIQLLESFVQQKGRTQGGAKANFAEARLLEARAEALQSEATFQSFLEGNRGYLVSNDPSVRLKGMRLEAEYKLRQQLVATLAMNREQALLEEKNDVPIVNVLDWGNVPIEKSGPARGVMTVISFILAAGCVMAWYHRQWLRTQLFSGVDVGNGILAPKEEKL